MNDQTDKKEEQADQEEEIEYSSDDISKPSAKKDSKFMAIGQGIARSKDDAEEGSPKSNDDQETKQNTQATPAVEPPTIADSKPNDAWSFKPTYEDQYARYPQTTRTRGPFFRVFDLDDAASTASLEKLTDSQYPETAPQAIISETIKQFCEKTGSWKVLVTYYAIQYRILLPETHKP